MKKRKNVERKSAWFMVFVLVLLIGVVFVQISSAYVKNVEKEKELTQLQQELQAAREKQMDLLAQKEYMKSEEYIENTAREEFKLIKKGEKVFIQNNE